MSKRRREVTVSTVLFILALSILIATGGRAEAAPAYDLLSKFAFALLITVVIRVAMVFVYRDDGEAFDNFQDLGMEELYKRLTDKNFQELLGESKSISVLKTWFPENLEIEMGLKDAITKNKATVRLLLCEPSSALLRQRIEGAHLPPSEASSKVYHAVFKVHEWLTDKPGAKVEIRLYDAWPGCPVIWYGKKYGIRHSRRIIMGFYFRKAPSPAWPWIRVRTGSELARILEEQFDELWKLSTTRLKTLEEMKAWLDQNERFAESWV